MQGQLVHERANQVVRGEVENKAEGDGDGQSREGLLKDGQEEEGETQALEKGGGGGGDMRRGTTGRIIQQLLMIRPGRNT